MLRNTKIKIKEVPYSELIPGNTYLIHHNDERKRELKKNKSRFIDLKIF